MGLSGDSGYYILCVGSDVRNRRILEQALAGCHTVFAVNGFEALRSVNRDAFHAYVLDYWLPDWSGLQVCRYIRKADPKVPIVICGAPAPDDYRARAFRARATWYCCKPIDHADLRRKISALLDTADLESKRAQRELLRAIDDEIELGVTAAVTQPGLEQKAISRSIERSARRKAMIRFLKAGGTLAHFDAMWSESFSTTWANHDHGGDT